MLRNTGKLVCDRLAWIALGLIVGALTATTVSTQPAPPPAPAQQAQGAPPPRIFTGDAGLVLSFVKPDKTKEFEAILAKMRDALLASTKPERKEQAKGWRIYKSSEPAAGGAALYVFVVDPPVKNTDYAVTSILAEALPADEMTQLAKQYVDTYASGQNFVNLALLADLGK